MTRRLLSLICPFLAAAMAAGVAAPPQPRISLEDAVARLDQSGRVRLDAFGVELLEGAFEWEDRAVESVVCAPADEGDASRPGVLLIPGYSRSARDYIPLMIRLARRGYVCMSVAQPGFGRSDGPPDFVGPRTMGAVGAAFDRLRALEGVDPERVGVFGYSRGAMAASLLACDRVDMACVALAAGIYDLELAAETIEAEGIRRNIESETGGAREALRARSSIHLMERLACPALILHGRLDVNAPYEQAALLDARLIELGKEHRLVTFEDRDHDLGRENLERELVRFLDERLAP